MTAASTTVSSSGENRVTVTLPALPAGAAYGSPTASGTIAVSNMSISGTTLTYTVSASNAGDTGTITIPVTGATNYEDYNLAVTITSVAASTQVSTQASTAESVTSAAEQTYAEDYQSEDAATEDSTNVNTGDHSNMALSGFLLLLSASGMAGLAAYRRKFMNE